MLSMFARLFKALHSESSPWQVAIPFSLSMIVGFTPLFSLLNVLLLLIVCLVRINVSAFLLGAALFSGIAWLINPFSVQVGETLLTHSALVPFFTTLYQSEFWRVSGFNNTLLLGGLVIALVAFLPVLLISKHLIIQYRERFMAWLNKLKIVQMLKASKLFLAYQRFGG